jgi:phosphopantothenoylcysteine decarboxylase/phosphopantothenate--cysteine ligase
MTSRPLSSLTVRQLDERIKKRLRLRAARNGRSLEEELRIILRAASGGDAALEDPVQEDGRAPRETAQPRGQRVLLVIGGGIAAYKALDLIRRLRERGPSVRVVMTAAAQQFVTPLAAGALASEPAYTDLFDARSEFDVGHIRLAREADLVVVAPATANLMARMAHGLADDLATAVLLATRAPILLAPAMNPAMWSHRATRRNLETLVADGVHVIGPNAGEMAESNEGGVGRMAEPIEIADTALGLLEVRSGALAGKRVLVTSGPTHEPIDPVRYIANRSSGKQGHAIAAAAAQAGAQVTLVSGPVNIPAPPGVAVVKVESAREMLRAVEAALPADVAVFAAAVADWRTADVASNKLKKDRTTGTPALSLVENPDILATIAHRKRGRPSLVVGFAAEAQNLVENAKKKLERKGCDWIVANDVSTETGVMGGDVNTVQIVTTNGVEAWPPQGKDAVAAALIARIARSLGDGAS